MMVSSRFSIRLIFGSLEQGQFDNNVKKLKAFRWLVPWKHKQHRGCLPPSENNEKIKCVQSHRALRKIYFHFLELLHELCKVHLWCHVIHFGADVFLNKGIFFSEGKGRRADAESQL